MKQEAIDKKELFSLLVLFELGSALLFSLGADAKQHAWLAVLLGMISGFGIIYFYIELARRTEYQPLTQVLRIYFGKYIGWIVGFTYVIYFIYIASRVLRDFTSLLQLAAYEGTSFLTITVLMMFCIMYALYLGIEVFARFTILIFYIITSFLSVIVILQIISGQINFQNIQPIFEGGIVPILKATYPLLITVPYGELIVFLMIFPLLNTKGDLLRTGLYSVGVAGGILVLFTLLNLLILGQDVFMRSTFPLLTSVSYINVANFIQRLESIVIVLMVLIGFIKIHLFTYGATLACSDLFQFPKNKLIYPVTFFVVISSVFIATSQSDHIQEGLKLVPYYLHLPFQFVIPIILFFLAMLKKKGSSVLR